MLVLRKETPEEYLNDIRKQKAQNAKNIFGVPTLCSAIQKFRSVSLVEELLKDGAMVDEFTRMGRLRLNKIAKERFRLWGDYTAIHEAVALGQCKIVKLLLNHGADLSTKTTKGVECLQFICDPYRRCEIDEIQVTEKDDLEILKIMRKDDILQSTVLHKATVRRCIEIVKYLLSLGFDVNCVDAVGSTPLHHCGWNNMEVAKVLLENDADPNAQDENGNTLYHHMLANYKFGKTPKILPDILRLLNKFNANLNVPNEYGKTALHVGLENIELHDIHVLYQLELVDLMLRQGSDPNVKDIFERTPVYYLVVILEIDHSRVLDLVWSLLTKLIHFGANLTYLDITGTPLFHALVNGLMLYPEHFDAKLWIEILHPKYKVNLNVQDCYNRTVLHLVAAKGDWYLGEVFLRHGGNLDIIDCDGNTPLDVAILCKRWEFARNVLLWTVERAECNDPSNCSGCNNEGDNITNKNVDSQKQSLETSKGLKRSSSSPSFKAKRQNEFSPLGASAKWTKTKLDTVAKLVAIRGNEFYLTSRKWDPKFWETDLCPQPRISERFLTQINRSSLRRLCEENSLEFHLTETCDEEHCLLARQVFNLVRDLVERCSEMDPRMKSKLHWTGSSSEGTKIWLPDEFDLLMELVELKDCCYIDDSLRSPTNVILYGEKCKTAWSNLCAGLDFVLSSTKLKEYLSSLLWKAALDLNRQKYPNIHFKLCRYARNGADRNYESFFNDTKVGVNLTMFWNGDKYKNLTVSVDLTPAIPLVISEREIRDFNEHAVKELSDQCIHVVPYLGNKTNLDWRPSFSLIEVRIVKSLTPKQILLYKCLKLLRDLHEDNLSPIPSYYLKTFLLTSLYENPNDQNFMDDKDFYTSALCVIHSLKQIVEREHRVIQHFFLNMPLSLIDYDMRWCESILKHLQSS